MRGKAKELKPASNATKPHLNFQCKRGRNDLCISKVCTCKCGHVTE